MSRSVYISLMQKVERFGLENFGGHPSEMQARGWRDLKCGLPVTLVVIAFLSVAALSQPRKVTIYPVSHDVKQWEALRNGSLYHATRYSAIVTVDVDPKTYIKTGTPLAPRLYSIHCDVTKTWDHCHELIDVSYAAEIDGKHMNITAQWGGNQHKPYSDKYEIDDIRPVGSQ